MSIVNTTASGTYIVPNAFTALNGTETYAFTAKADVFTGTTTTGQALQPSIHVTNPGVFTAGTAPEGTLSKTTNDVQV